MGFIPYTHALHEEEIVMRISCARTFRLPMHDTKHVASWSKTVQRDEVQRETSYDAITAVAKQETTANIPVYEDFYDTKL